MKDGDMAYFVDLDRGIIINGEVKNYYSDNCKNIELWPTPNMGHIINRDRVGSTINESVEKFEKWKVTYKQDLLNDNLWIKELFNGWELNYQDNEVQPSEIIKIMREIIKEKVGVDPDKD